MKLTPETWLLLNSIPGAADFNMALDEALLEFAAQIGKPVLRFYGWTERAASFGYSQRYVEVARLTLLRPLVRRPTGGGLVPHDADWTYSLVFPPDHWWYAARAQESYQRVHEWIRDAFARLNIATELSDERRKASAGQCFVGAERFDLLWHGRKIAGAAQRRNRQGLLIQGSVQPPPLALARADWQKALCDAARQAWSVEWSPFDSHAAVGARTEELGATANLLLPRPAKNERGDGHPVEWTSSPQPSPPVGEEREPIESGWLVVVTRCAQELVRRKYSLDAYNQRR